MTPRLALARAPLLAAALAALAAPLQAQAPRPAEIAVGQRVEAEITASDPRLEDESHYDTWRFLGIPGQRVEIVMESDDFDAYLILSTSREPGATTVDTDDDGGGGTNARLVLTLERDEYWIFANTLGAAQTGRYSLRVATVEAKDAHPGGDRHGTLTTALVYTPGREGASR